MTTLAASFPLRLTADAGRTFGFPSSLRGPVGAGLVCVQGLTLGLARAFSARQDLKATNPATTRLRGLCVLAGDASESLVRQVSLRVAGQAVDFTALDMGYDADSAAWDLSVTLADVQGWMLCEPGATAQVELDGETFGFVVDARSRSRSFPAPEYKAEGRSPITRLALPHAEPVTTTWPETRARTVALELLSGSGMALDWRCPDWTIAEGALSVQDQSPLEVLKSLVGAVGAVATSNAAGDTLVVLPRYPVSPEALAGVTPVLELSDLADIVSVSQTLEPKPGYDSVRVMDKDFQAARASVRLEDISGSEGGSGGAGGSGDVRTVAVRSHPFVAWGLEHSGGPGVRLTDLGEHTEDLEETVEVVRGEASLRYPAEVVLTHAYRDADLGPVTVVGDLVATATVGQTLLWLRYRTRFQKYRVENAALNELQIFVRG